MIRRNAETALLERARQYPVLVVTGPRQAGKTTLARMVFPSKTYVSFERLDMREYATSDPLGFLAEHAGGAVLDEVQHVPELLSYLQVDVDENPQPGRFVLTGSQHFGLSQQVSQSLAGRATILTLLPPSLDELVRFQSVPDELTPTLWAGAYPRIHDRRIPPSTWLSDYVTTYVQRDVRELLQVGDLTTFTTFVRLCAGRTSQEVNLSALGGDAGVSHNTARAWLSVLETSFICTRVPAWHDNRRKQLIKAPKLHFLDSGLASHLLGIADPTQLQHHPLRGALLESWVAAEIVKAFSHRGLQPALWHLRRVRGPEVDLIVEGRRTVRLVEVKSAATVHDAFFVHLNTAAAEIGDTFPGKAVERIVVFGGGECQSRSRGSAVPWREVQGVKWAD